MLGIRLWIGLGLEYMAGASVIAGPSFNWISSATHRSPWDVTNRLGSENGLSFGNEPEMC